MSLFRVAPGAVRSRPRPPLARRAHRKGLRTHATPLRLGLEFLEDRTLLSGLGWVQPDYVVQHPVGPVAPLGTSGPTGYTPSQIRHAYGVDRIALSGGVAGDGSGTTIAIVDAFDNPNVVYDLHQFDHQFGLPDPTFTKVNQSGGTAMPYADASWASEISLDVEWSHAIAPKANILLVESTDNWFSNILAAISYAAHQPGVVAVSMSFGASEDASETSFDNTFVTPGGHSGVTYIAASGDRGAPPEYPAISPNVLSVGGTTLNLDSQGNPSSESGWSGSGGGISAYEAQPAFQKNLIPQNSTWRLNPDVAYDADPYTGFPVYDSYNNGFNTPWSQFGGTSDAAPQWAGLIAIADQARALAGKSALDGPKQALPMLYQFSSADFTDITSGSSLGKPNYSAGPGYDLVTGRGTPLANNLVTDFLGNVAPTGPYFSISTVSSTTAGSPISVTVTALDQNGNILNGYTGTVHFTSSDGMAAVPANYTFKASDNGVHTFTNGVLLVKAGTESITVTDTAASSMTGSAAVNVVAANPNHLSFGQQPANTVAGSSITPAVTVQVLDQYNNVVAWSNNGNVSVALGNNAGNGTLSGTLTAAVSSGLATFNNLSINKTGTGYTLSASSSLGTATSASFNITPGKASQLAFGQAPTNTPAGSNISPAITAQVLDALGNLATNDSSDAIAMALGANPGNGSLLGTSPVTVQNGVATFSNLSINKPGNGYTLVASGTGLTSVTSPTFNITLASTTTAVVSSANPIEWKKTVTFTATISGSGTPTGVVVFSDGGTSIGQGTLNSSGGKTTASFSTSGLAVGNHSITATYGGDSNFSGSTATFTQTVSKASTTTVVVSATNPTALGQNAIFTATVSGPGNPTGLVIFLDNGTSIGQGTLTTSGGTTTASLTTSTLAIGSHPLTASYGGDANFAGSTSTAITQTVTRAATSTVLVSSADSSLWGQGVTFTATVAGSGSPTGIVVFSDGATSIGQGTLATSGGKTTASFTTSGLSVASHTITASYGGDSNFSGSSSTAITQTVNKASTSAVVTSTANAAVWGQSVTFTATISIAAPGAGTPAGTVQFQIDGSNVGNPVSVSTASGATTASFSTALAVGSHTVIANYGGDANFNGSASTALTQTVNKASSTIAVVSSTNLTVWGQSVTFTATIGITAPGAGTPTGMVQFQIDGSNAGSPVNISTTSGVTTASFSSATLAVGSHIVTATYGGDTNFGGSSSLAITQTVNKASSTTAVVSSSNATVWGQTVIFTATVTGGGPGNPTGVVIFSDGGTNIGQGSLTTSGGTITASFLTSSLSVGSHSITAAYSGDNNFQTSTATLIQTVNQAGSTTGLLSSANPALFGQPLTFTATITAIAPGAGTPTGSVQFQIDGNNFGSPVALNGSQATSAAASTLSVSGHTVTAVYSGDTDFNTSTATLIQTVNQAGSTTGLLSSANPALFGQPLTFTATITAIAPGAGMPTGSVQFQIDGNNFGSAVPVSGGQAISPAANILVLGGHTISAIYSGDANFTASTGTLLQSITPGPASVLLVSGFPSLSAAGALGTFTVTVQDAYGNTATGYRGTVHFTSTDNLASLPADYAFTATDNGIHSFTAVFLTAGSQSLTATDTLSGSITGTQSGIAITPAAPDHFLVAPVVTTTVAGTPFDVSVAIKDAYNNTVSSYTGTVSFSSADPHGATLPADYTFTAADNGSHTFAAAATLYTAGPWDVTVLDKVSGVSGSRAVLVRPAPAVRFQVVAPSSIFPNTPFDVTVTALDPYLNVDSNYQGTLAFSTTDAAPGVILPGSYLFTANDAGVHTFTAGVSLVTPGGQTLSVTDTNGLTGNALIAVIPPGRPPGGGDGKGLGEGDGTLELTANWVSARIVRLALPVDTSPRGTAGREVVPWSKRPYSRRATLPTMEEVIDLLFSARYERASQMGGEGVTDP